MYMIREVNHFFLLIMFYVTFFPQLIAGPIVLANQMLPQIINAYNKIKSFNFFVIGIFFFFIGLFKKYF